MVVKVITVVTLEKKLAKSSTYSWVVSHLLQNFVTTLNAIITDGYSLCLCLCKLLSKRCQNFDKKFSIDDVTVCSIVRYKQSAIIKSMFVAGPTCLFQVQLLLAVSQALVKPQSLKSAPLLLVPKPL